MFYKILSVVFFILSLLSKELALILLGIIILVFLLTLNIVISNEVRNPATKGSAISNTLR